MAEDAIEAKLASRGPLPLGKDQIPTVTNTEDATMQPYC